MRFDLFDAVNTMRNEFGSSGEILLRWDAGDVGYKIILQIFYVNKLYRASFLIPLLEVTDCKVNVMNVRFADCISRLKREIYEQIL